MAVRRRCTAESIFATSFHGMRTRPEPPSRPASRPSQPARVAQYPGPERIATTSGTLDREVVDVAAAATVLVEELVVENVMADVNLLHQFCPTFVISISGMAATAITRITIR